MNTGIMSFLFLPLIFGVLVYSFDKVWFSRFVFAMQTVMSVGFVGLYINKDYSMVIGGWSNTVGIEMTIDPISLVFVAMTLISFWFILLYDWPKRKNDHKYLFLICVLESVMLSLFLTYDLFTMFVLIELMTIIASILITYKKDSISVKAGIYYLMINSLGMVLYIMGVMILYSLTGSLNIHVIVAQLPAIMSGSLFKISMAFLISSLAVKSAWFPVFHWLPVAHSAAPGSISALLSGLIVKSGLFVLIRIESILFTSSFGELLLYIGLSTALVGVILAMLQSDIKRILSFHTVSQIGLMLIGLSVPNTLSSFGGMLHLFNHILFKSLLFLCAGLIITQTGERNLKKLSGLMKINPILSFCMIIGMLAITGFPLLNGQLGKLLIKSTIGNVWVTMSLYLISIGTLVSFIKMSKIFFGPAMKSVVSPKDRQPAVYVMSILTLVAFPLELVYLKVYNGPAFAYTQKSLLSNSLEYFILAALAYGIYFNVLAPAIRRNSKTLQFIKGFGKAYFTESSALLAVFLGAIHVFVTSVK